MLKQVAKLVLETSGIIPWEFVRARLENRATPVRDPRHGQEKSVPRTRTNLPIRTKIKTWKGGRVRFIAAVSKTVEASNPPRVRISPLPPL